MKASVMWVLGLSFLVGVLNTSIRAEASPPMKEWSFLIFINGNNSLDSFGPMNINSMEEVGSSPNLNILVQHSTMSTQQVNRLYITKDNNTNKVTSPIVQKLPNVDMGDYKSVIDFVAWANTNYPAKHMFIALWDHGSGWRDVSPAGDPFMNPKSPDAINSGAGGLNLKPLDIAWDEKTGHHITTPQMGLIMEESAKILGHKVDVYGSDACLMGMAEIAGEMADSVETFVGSQDLEPGEGWPYSTFLKAWAQKPMATSQEVGDMLVKAFIAAYSSGGIYGPNDATLSAFDMSKLQELQESIKELSLTVANFDAAGKTRFLNAVKASQRFYYEDYVDLIDMMGMTKKAPVPLLPIKITNRIEAAAKAMVSSNGTTPNFQKATGLSVWVPDSASVFDDYSKGYANLKFSQNTGWGDALNKLFH